jgi:hypothetical protein
MEVTFQIQEATETSLGFRIIEDKETETRHMSIPPCQKAIVEAAREFETCLQTKRG